MNMLCNGKSGKCDTNVKPKLLADRDHYECEECGETWDTDPAPLMESPGQLHQQIDRRPCTCPPKEPWTRPPRRAPGTTRNRYRTM
jgi:hypothetical protein